MGTVVIYTLKQEPTPAVAPLPVLFVYYHIRASDGIGRHMSSAETGMPIVIAPSVAHTTAPYTFVGLQSLRSG